MASGFKINNFGDEFTSGDIEIGAHRPFVANNLSLNFLPIYHKTGGTILVKTPSVFLQHGPGKYKNYLPVRHADVDFLATLGSLEVAVEQKLHTEEALLSGLPDNLITAFGDYPYLRPSIDLDKEAYFAKMSTDFKCYNWNGEEMSDRPEGAGEYEMLFRVGSIYFGGHGPAVKYTASLHVRLVQLRYRPIGVELGHMDRCLLGGGGDGDEGATVVDVDENAQMGDTLKMGRRLEDTINSMLDNSTATLKKPKRPSGGKKNAKTNIPKPMEQ